MITGIAAAVILLGAVEKGLGGCILGAIDREGIRGALEIENRFAVLLVIALGKPKERVALETAKDASDIKYWRTEDGVHHVPKRRLKDIIIN
ncbi:MAG: nitroreductase family protein [Candidatus Omnitrophota bacterium]